MADEHGRPTDYKTGLGPVEAATVSKDTGTRIVTRTRPSGRVKQS